MTPVQVYTLQIWLPDAVWSVTAPLTLWTPCCAHFVIVISSTPSSSQDGGRLQHHTSTLHDPATLLVGCPSPPCACVSVFQ